MLDRIFNTWPSSIRLLLWLILTLESPCLVAAGNHTVDDADPAIIYAPVERWNVGNLCTACFARPPDTSSIYQQTWHDTTRGNETTPIYFEYTFIGTALYIYGILINIVETDFLFTTNVHLILTVDNQRISYQHEPLDTDSYEYQVPVFSLENLPNQSHSVRVALNPSSNFLFDYLVYTTPDPTDTPTSAPSLSVTTFTVTSSSESSSTSASASTSTSTSMPASTSISTPTSILASSSQSLSTLGLFSLSDTLFISQSYGNESERPSPSSLAKSGLAPGEIAGIVIGSLAVVFLVAFIILFLCYKHRKQQKQPNIALPVATTSHLDPLVSVPGPSTQFMPIPSTNALLGPAASVDEISSGSDVYPRRYEAPLSFRPVEGMSSSDVSNSALNSKQRMMQIQYLPAQIGSSGSGTRDDDMSSHTGPTSSSGRGHAYPVRMANDAPLWAQTMEPLYPHGVYVPVQGSAAPDYTSEGGYLHSEAESASSTDPVLMGAASRGRNVHVNHRSVTQGSLYSEGRPPSAPPPYPCSPPLVTVPDAPPIPNLAPIHEKR